MASHENTRKELEKERASHLLTKGELRHENSHSSRTRQELDEEKTTRQMAQTELRIEKSSHDITREQLAKEKASHKKTMDELQDVRDANKKTSEQLAGKSHWKYIVSNHAPYVNTFSLFMLSCTCMRVIDEYFLCNRWCFDEKDLARLYENFYIKYVRHPQIHHTDKKVYYMSRTRGDLIPTWCQVSWMLVLHGDLCRSKVFSSIHDI